ncbi:MAG: site-specific DNA-methyltransferase [Methanosarcinales archaeon]|jgi:site-specific DNA-methyltransferase (adenine-specific)|nr:site-specific DNA-methyltransferase [Methanosarcinales archaeon]
MIIIGDCLEKLKEFESGSIDCVITSPPYYLQRDYNVSGQIGLEKTVDEYVNSVCDVFDEVKRILKKTGTVYLIVGDKYATQSGRANQIRAGKSRDETQYSGKKIREVPVCRKGIYYNENEKATEKCLMKLPDRIGIEMIRRGWILRNEIIWEKTNAMPESAKDRFSNNFEKIFFFVKSTEYYFKTQYEPKELHETRKYKILTRRTTGKREIITDFSNKRRKRCVWKIPKVSDSKSIHTAGKNTQTVLIY